MVESNDNNGRTIDSLNEVDKCDDSANLTVRQEGSPKSALPELDFSSIKFPNASTDSECFLVFKCEKSPSHAEGQTTPNATTTC